MISNERISDQGRSRDRLHSSVASSLEAQIMSGELAIGERLPSESEIARDFGVSTRSVREAIQILETKGLVRRRHGERTTVVRDDVGEFLGTLAITVRQLFSSDPEYLLQLMVVRRMIETEVVGLLTASEDPVGDEVRAALDAMRQARDSGDFSGFTEADAAFHLALVHSTGNQILSVFYDNLYGLITEVIRVTSRVPSKSLDAAYAEHADILAMIQNRDEAGAKALMRAQIDNSAAYLRVAIKNSKDKDGKNA
ncbi:FadR/GntR family transcriptional regulator [Phyllobacterium sp. 0TCS1.6C]|uniref:FadR/GntR family transcriptional regulator n=1 Tax=Phyllobacterium sp. 0TCS1.6A TaxID=2995637 RepID=UPI002264F8B9|nr:FadR/GntR family transcriptional regulator [Phyllobacterium sp. 0TCS1.6A]MCX8279052.1 FadR/GntR family transcriptional regulator [Phyllobacterium sp. 0TCS1.6C]MCX8293836.1 FadR/GntR family transcriptional regulator [Phyllobacterium sp. 0TCS1.6A]